MVRQAYAGLGCLDAAVREFDALKPYAAELLDLRRSCRFGSADHNALGVAYDGLQTAAFHFTRRPQFYLELEIEIGPASEGNGRLSDRAEAAAAFDTLAPYAQRLRSLRTRCRPLGRDYLVG